MHPGGPWRRGGLIALAWLLLMGLLLAACSGGLPAHLNAAPPRALVVPGPEYTFTYPDDPESAPIGTHGVTRLPASPGPRDTQPDPSDSFLSVETWDKVMVKLTHMHNRVGRVTERQRTVRLMVELARVGKLTLLQQVIRYVERKDVALHWRPWATLLFLMDERKAWDLVLRVYGHLLASGWRPLRPDQAIKVYHTVLWALKNTGQYEALCLLFRELRLKAVIPMTPRAYKLLLTTLYHMRRPRELLEEFRAMQAARIPGDVGVHNLVLGAHGDRGNWIAARDLLRRMRSGNVRPDVGSYNVAIAACVRAQELDPALALLQTLCADGLTPTVVTYSQLILGCARRRRHDCAMGLFQEMKASGIVPDAASYHVVLIASALSHEWDQVRLTFQEMLEAGLRPQRVAINALLLAYSATGAWRRAWASFEQMLDRGMRPDLFSFNMVISACCKAGRVDWATHLASQMPRHGVRPDDATFRALVRGFGRRGQWSEALQAYSAMGRAGVAPTDRTLNSLIFALCRAGQWSLAREQFLLSLRHPPAPPRGPLGPTYTRNLVLSAMGDAGEYAAGVDLYNETRTAVPPDSVTYNLLLQLCQQGNLWEPAVRISREMLTKGYQLDLQAAAVVTKTPAP